MTLLHNVDGVHTSEGHFLQMFFSLLGAPYMGITEELKKKKDNLQKFEFCLEKYSSLSGHSHHIFP